MSDASWEKFGHLPAAGKPWERFSWTQYGGDHGPGLELLHTGPGKRVLELGMGKGDNLALVARTGASAVGVDISAPQIEAARERFGGLIEAHHGRAEEYLSGREAEFDSIYSVFGAVWFTDPAVLLPLVRRALKPGGRFAFSHLPPSGECPGPHEYDLYGPGDELLTITRWCFRPYLWEEKLRAAGFASAAGQRLPCPKDRQTIGTLVVRATV
ncbi:class I SAM-dependent methyltransferase [Streptomyces sp. WAC05292]|uniref:class I SAM-dependent methyltransferase n=1 Tax=Streptomyces sp. WAC05292 TaxID=2487418 RepID=UPI000F74666F|nr:class I SAM-dependent methyltransferase [Streptomyces sp. WAC05292]RSS82299.1 class I SAM-dependent methyltransferase [Streptomyces sp. WAC05292]